MNKGLIKKEFYNLRINLLACFLFVLIFFVVSFFKKYEESDSMPQVLSIFLNSLSYIGIGLAYSLTILISSFASDEQSRWNTFLISQGISRKNILKTKYFVIFLTTLVLALLSLFTIIPLLKFYSVTDSLIFTLSIFLSILSGGIVGGILFTLFLLIFGVSKGSLFVIFGLLFEAIPLTIFFLLMMLFNSSYVSLNNGFILLFMFIDLLFSLLVSFIIYRITLRLFNKKEF